MPKNIFSLDQKNLIRRYLVWCYKTTKEDLDKIDRYFTQNHVDNFILSRLKKLNEYQENADFKQKVHEFSDYMDKKYQNALNKKYSDKTLKKLTKDYFYLIKRLDSIEKSIFHFLGKTEVIKIKREYENEMTTRIWQAREHT